MKKHFLLFSSFIVLMSSQALSNSSTPTIKKPKLIVVLIIDQFRADYLTRFKERFLPAKNSNGAVGGFNYLISNGAYFPYAQYDILQSMTGPGHATLLTGSYPYQSGIPLNDWYDSKLGKNIYCVEDEGSPIVGLPENKDLRGMSPKNLIGSTVGDELKNAGYPSKVISIALKDRAAILMGGHRADLSLWFDPKSFQWISSRYYLPEGNLPSWVTKLNEEVKIKKSPMKVWSAKLQETMKSYFATTSSYPNDKKLTGKIGPTFNHGIAACSPEELSSPYGNELTAQAALRAIDFYDLGKNITPDLLAVSFSSHDYVGHAFGPNSKEIEDMTVSEDRVISTFLNNLKNKIPGGLKEVVVVLSADHGVAPNSDWLLKNKMASGRVDIGALQAKIEERLNQKFGKIDSGKGWITYSIDFNYYINRDGINSKKLSKSDVENEIKKVLQMEDGFVHVFTHTDYENRLLPPGMHERQILKTYFSGRSGDVIAIPKPFFVHGDDNSTTHMTGYSYDRTVPLIIAGAGFKHGIIPKMVDVVDIAPTLTILTGTIPPSSSEGRVLTEAFNP
ncbi:MAG: alkaline phosphatase family protein [Bacteriovorax sp.]|nr:alkaline phosphatase family protein [Bacteriovorax sp.]